MATQHWRPVGNSSARWAEDRKTHFLLSALFHPATAHPPCHSRVPPKASRASPLFQQFPKFWFWGILKPRQAAALLTQQKWLRLSALKTVKPETDITGWGSATAQTNEKMNPASSEKVSYCDTANCAVSCMCRAMHEESRTHLAATPPPARDG